MKICQINSVYGEGSTGKIVRDLHHSLINSIHDSIVIHPVPCKHSNESGVYTFTNQFLSYTTAIYRRILGRQFDGAWIQTIRLIDIIKKENPDIVHLHCINGNCINIYMLLKYLAKEKIKTIYTLHAEYPYTGGCGNSNGCERWRIGCGKCPNFKKLTQSVFIDGTSHTFKMQELCYRNFPPENFTIATVSPWLEKRAKQSKILEGFSIHTVMNGIDTSIFCPRNNASLRKRFQILESQKLLLHVTTSFNTDKAALKGGYFINMLATRLLAYNIKIIVVASNKSTFDSLSPNISYIGRAENQVMLAELYSAADLTIITSKSETFSMVTAESLCCGTPVVGFKAGGPESISLPDYSEFVPYGNMEALQESVLNWLKIPKNPKKIANEAKHRYSKERMYLDYSQIYMDLINNCLCM